MRICTARVPPELPAQRAPPETVSRPPAPGQPVTPDKPRLVLRNDMRPLPLKSEFLLLRSLFFVCTLSVVFFAIPLFVVQFLLLQFACLSSFCTISACLTLSIYSRPPLSVFGPGSCLRRCPASVLLPRAPFPHFPLCAAAEALVACPVPPGPSPQALSSGSSGPSGPSGSLRQARDPGHGPRHGTTRRNLLGRVSNHRPRIYCPSFNRRQSDLT